MMEIYDDLNIQHVAKNKSSIHNLIRLNLMKFHVLLRIDLIKNCLLC